MAEAEKMFTRALSGYEKAWGAEHTSTLNAINNLGAVYRALGQTARAEEMFTQALSGYEKALGAEHTSTLMTVNNLGALYADQGKMAEAEKMFTRALHGYEKLSCVPPARIESVEQSVSSLRHRSNGPYNEQASEKPSRLDEDYAIPSTTSSARKDRERPRVLSKWMRKMWKRS
jgi:tetratricopeptide (TPR) repeat protein